MKGARYKSTILLSGPPDQLQRALRFLTAGRLDDHPIALTMGFEPYRALTLPLDENSSSKRLNNLHTFGCEKFKKATKLNITHNNGSESQIELRVKTLGGFPERWLKTLSQLLPDWEFVAFYQSRDDHVDIMLRLQDGSLDLLHEDRQWWISPNFSGHCRLDDFQPAV
jgi:hypothetical protein